MTLKEKNGQMAQADLSALDEADIKTYFLGSVLSGGGSDPSEENTFDDWRATYNRLQSRALKPGSASSSSTAWMPSTATAVWWAR